MDKNSLTGNFYYKIPYVSHGFVYKYLCKIKTSKATGFDEISARFLKLFAPYITDSIVKLCNLSIREDRFSNTSANKWCEENKMQLSIIKIKVALVGSKQ